jgi:hypothetical protein
MAAPKLGLVVFQNGTPSNTLYQASRLSQMLVEGEILHSEGNYYRYANNQGGVFSLVCVDCNELGCNEPRIRKLGERGFQGSGNWDSHFAHFSALEHNHAADCLCADGAVGTGERIKRRIIESKFYIPAHQHDYLGQYRFPLVMELVTPSDVLTDYEKKWLANEINVKLGESVEALGNELPDGIIWRGVVKNKILSRLTIPMDDQSSYYIGQRNFHDLSHMFWKKNIDNELLPLKITSNAQRATLTITGEGSFYKACEDGMRQVAAPVIGNRIQPGNRQDVIDWFQEETRNMGLEPIIKQQKMDCTIFTSTVKARFVYLRNRSAKRKIIRLSVQEIGSAQAHEREEMTVHFQGMSTEYLGAQEGQQFKSLEIESNSSKLIRILFTGNVHFRIEQQGQLIENQHIFAGVGSPSLRIRKQALTTQEFERLIQDMHPDYLSLPTQGDAVEIGKKDWIDFDRFMFTKSLMSAGEGYVAPQGIAARNTKLLNLLTSFESLFVDDEILDTGTTDRFQLMMETSYNGIENETVDLEQDERAFIHRLSPTERGWFGPQDSEYKLLIDYRSWSHLKTDCPELVGDDIQFLETGHRLIRSEAISRYDRPELSEIEHLQPKHSLPEDHLFFPFDEGDVAEQQQRYLRLVTNLNTDSAREYTFAQPFSQQPRFGVFSKELRTSSVLRDPWAHSEPFVIERDFDGKVQVLSLHRIVLDPEDDVEGVDARHNLVLILRQGNIEPRAVRVFFTGSFSRPPSHSDEEWDSLTQKARRIAVFAYMRDTVRAYTSLSMRLQGHIRHIDDKNVNEIVSYTVRKFCEAHEQSLLNTMRDIDESLAAQFLQYMGDKMWFENKLRD